MQGSRIDQMVSDLGDEFGESEALRTDVEARFRRYATAHVQDFVPIFVEREFRRESQTRTRPVVRGD